MTSLKAPSILVFDSSEVLFPRADCPPELKFGLFSSLTNVKNPIFVVLLTRDSAQMDLQVRQFIEEEILISQLLPTQRYHMMMSCCKLLQIDIGHQDLEDINRKCHGYKISDIFAFLRGVKYLLKDSMDQITSDILERSRKMIPVNSKLNVQKISPVQWSDIGGLENVKIEIENTLLWSLKNSESFKAMGITPPRGVLLYGPPGTGKTMIAKAVATSSLSNFLPVAIPDLLKGEIGESEKAIEKVFNLAKSCSPCVIFLDEIDAIFGNKTQGNRLGEKMISQLLLELDSLEMNENGNGIIVLAATNIPWIIDPAILRAGRLELPLYVGPPDEHARLNILEIYSKKLPLSKDINLKPIAKMTEMFTGADLKNLCRNAAVCALKKYQDINQIGEPCVTQEDFIESLSGTKPSLTDAILFRFQNPSLNKPAIFI